ncbi:hypothetical protein, partial [Lapillicoccus sp.]|uniref:hypothetical protein n=1 Tax=Lapillicoccus sp. TaxID=1909287 RepID=UPI003266763C
AADMGALVADAAELERVLARALTEVLIPRRAFIRIVLVEAIRNPSTAAPVFAALDTVLEDSLTRFTRAGLVSDIATTKSLLFYFGLLPALFRVAVEEDPTGLPGGPAALAGSLARIEQALVCARSDPL